MNFDNQLRRFSDKTEKTYKDVFRRASFNLFSAIVLDTPVDKGVLRNNWFVALDSPSSETTMEEGTGSGAIVEADSILKNVDLDTEVFITNNLPYAETIEFDGHSAQAPEGMVRINTARWDSIVQFSAAEVI